MPPTTTRAGPPFSARTPTSRNTYLLFHLSRQFQRIVSALIDVPCPNHVACRGNKLCIADPHFDMLCAVKEPLVQRTRALKLALLDLKVCAAEASERVRTESTKRRTDIRLP